MVSHILEVLPHRPIDPLLKEILQQVCQTTHMLKLEFFVGGAMARDILLSHVFDQRTIRATRDVDLGVYVNHWEEFAQLKARLVDSGQFSEERGCAQRLKHRNGLPLDLIPFGGISAPDQSIAWPPEHDVVLNVSGFDDAFRASITVDIGNGLRVQTCSLPSLAVLKLIAWKDRGLENNKDATDFWLIALRYGPAQNEARLYDAEHELLIQNHGNLELAGAELLGRDAACQCQKATATQITDILSNTMLRQRLVDQLLRATHSLVSADEMTHIEEFIDAFIRGFTFSTH